MPDSNETPWFGLGCVVWYHVMLLFKGFICQFGTIFILCIIYFMYYYYFIDDWDAIANINGTKPEFCPFFFFFKSQFIFVLAS